MEPEPEPEPLAPEPLAGNRARRVSRPDMRRSLNKKALIARTASHLPEALQAQIEKTKLELDTLIKQDLERQRKKSRSLVLSVEQLLALLEAFEELCTDEDKWRYLVYEVDRCMKNVRDLISGFQQQSMLKRAVAFRQNSSNYNELTLDIGIDESDSCARLISHNVQDRTH